MAAIECIYYIFFKIKSLQQKTFTVLAASVGEKAALSFEGADFSATCGEIRADVYNQHRWMVVV